MSNNTLKIGAIFNGNSEQDQGTIVEEIPDFSYLALKYSFYNLEHFYKKLNAENIKNFDYEFIDNDYGVIRNCVSSYDLISKIVVNFYKNDFFAKPFNECINKAQQSIMSEINMNEDSIHILKRENSTDNETVSIIKKTEDILKELKQEYLYFESIKNTGKIDFSRKITTYPNFHAKLVECFFYNFKRKGFKKEFNQIISFILDFYSGKKSRYEENFKSRFNLLAKELKLSKYEYKILMFAYTNLIHNITFVNKKVKNLFRTGIISNNLHNWELSWVGEYLFNNVSIEDCLIKSNRLNLDEDIDIFDYPIDMQDKIKNVENLIRNYNCENPLNILLWGESGCGKSTLVKLFQSHIPEKKFVEINNELLYTNRVIRDKSDMEDRINDFPDETKACLRMRELKICSSVVRGSKFVLVMDEADDVLNSSNGITDGYLTGKKEINELLQDLKIPVIWITNHKNKIDSSTCRRFQYSIKFDRLSVSQREKVWNKQIEITNTEALMKDININEFASSYDLNPGVISTVLNNLKSLKPHKDQIFTTLKSLIENHLNLVEEKEIKDERTANNDKYDIKGLNIKSQFSIDKIVPAIRKFDTNKNKKSLCLLFNGVPGAGKTEFAKYIARELDKKLHYIVYSDVASCWVGESEKNIKNAFVQAEKDNAILFFDEADSLIYSRENARHSWEITQTNEVLTRMERFKGIFIASTNFINTVDNAAMRRFQFKIEFDYLNNEGKEIFFERFFDKKIKNKDALFRINNLTPGDFKAVRDRLVYLDDNPSQEMILNELAVEVSYKNKGNMIGF